MLGTFLLMVLSVFISIIILVAIIASASSDETVITKNTLLHLRLDKPIVDRAPSMKFTFDLSGPGKMTGLNELLDNIRKAKHDENITGIYLDLTDIPAGISTLEEIRDALMAFKTSGKFIWAYSESYSQRAYYLASVADRVFLNPEGSLEFKGLAAELTFIKGLLDKIDVKMQIIRHGKFKAATEPLFLEKMSPENRKQITELINGIWNKMVADISESRKISKSSLSAIADSLKIETAADAVKAGLVDQLVYKDELIREMKKKMNVAESKKLSTVSDASYTSVPEKRKQGLSSEKIAVIYASGSIGSGEGDDESIGSERISKAIRKAREDEKVKAIVFRINSGGGSALASDVIWREIDLARQAKPVVASFGDVAASGGYYIACAASRIVANPTTLTGSIGVFGVVPNMEGLFSKKLGITFDRAMTNPNSDYISVVKPLTPYQEKKIQKDVDHIYDVFTGKVAEGRKISKAQVDSIGQGRIWNGIDAQRIKLLDEFGGLTRSVELAASMAGIKDYRLISLPEQKEWFEELISELMGVDPSSKIREILGPDYQLYEYMKEIREMKGIQARSLYEIEIR